MFKWFLIEVWLDQFHEIMIGSKIPNFLVLAECWSNFGFLEFFGFDSFDELESFRLMLIWIELDWISNWTKTPNTFTLAESTLPYKVLDFLFWTIGCVWNHLGCWFNVDCGFDWIETKSDTKSSIGREHWACIWVWFFIYVLDMWWWCLAWLIGLIKCFRNIDLGD